MKTSKKNEDKQPQEGTEANFLDADQCITSAITFKKGGFMPRTVSFVFSLSLLLISPLLVFAQPIIRSSIRCEDGSLPTTTPVLAVFAGAANSEIVPLVAAKQIRVFRWILQSTVDVQIKFVQGTGTNCGTGEVTLMDRIDPFSLVNRPVDSEDLPIPIVVPAGKALCLDSSAAATISGSVTFCVE